MNGPDGYKAIADPTRREIVRLLRDDDLPAGAIAERFDISWPSVSRHLAVLSAAGLIKGTRKGQQVVYSLSTSVLVDIVTELADMARVSAPRPEGGQVAASLGKPQRTKPRIKARVRPRLKEAES